MNHRNPAIKRILADVKELQKHPSSRYHAAPLESDMFEWHFTVIRKLYIMVAFFS